MRGLYERDDPISDPEASAVGQVVTMWRAVAEQVTATYGDHDHRGSSARLLGVRRTTDSTAWLRLNSWGAKQFSEHDRLPVKVGGAARI